MSPRRRPRASAVAYIAAIAILAWADTAATAAWTRPATIASLHAPVASGLLRPGWEPELFVGAGGGSTVYAWTNLDRAGSIHLQARTRATPRGPLGPTLDLSWSQSFYDNAQIAVGPRGHTIIVWSRPAPLMQSALQARAIVRGRLGPTIDLPAATLSGVSPYGVRVAVDGDGNAVFAWVLGDKRVQLQSLSAAGAPGAVVTVPTPDLRVGAPSVAVAASGAAVVAWDNATRGARRLYARTASTSGRIDPIVSLWVQREGHPRDRAIAPELAISDAGDVFAAWNRRGDHVSVQGRFLSAAGVLGPTVSLAPRKGQGAGYGALVAPGGHGVVVYGHGRRPRWHARLLSPGGALGRPAGVVTEQGLSAISVAGSGRAVCAWATADGVHARALTADQGLGPRHRLSARGERPYALAGYVDDVYRVRGAAGEHAVVAWLSAGKFRVRSATGP